MQLQIPELNFLHHKRRIVMPLENLIVLGIVGAGMLAFAVVTFWLTTESGAERKRESRMIAAE
jgi:hypothetical protein